MIKVIASDMDGTLLNNEHMLSERTIAAIKNAQRAGIRFMIATGRGFEQAMYVLKDTEIECDYIVSSGAEIRNPKKEIWQSGCMNMQDCRYVYEILQQYELMYLFGAEDADYCIGSTKDREQQLLSHILTFEQEMTEEEARETDLFKFMIGNTKVVSDFEKLEASGAKIIKIFAVSDDLEMLREIDEKLQKNKNLAVASSFDNNLEITDVKAQKGIALKAYIESLGYTMDEVMVFGDSMNDYSMLSMDFGATVAMENGTDKVKEAAKYITKSNAEDGVAYAIEKLLEKQEINEKYIGCTKQYIE